MADNVGDRPTKLSRADRLEKILASIRLNSSIRLSVLAEEYNVSAETIRRDLERLHSQGLISRTYGGAMSHAPLGDPSFTERMEANKQVRDAIASRAAKLVKPGDVIFVSSGVTSFQFAQHLSAATEEITVITTSVRVAQALGGQGKSRVILAPGDFDAVEQSVSGADTRAFLERFYGASVFFGASGLTEEGPNESRSPIAWNLRSMIGRAEQVVLLADRTKFGAKHLELISDLSAIDILVTDAAPENGLLRAINESAVQMIVAED